MTFVRFDGKLANGKPGSSAPDHATALVQSLEINLK